MHRQGDLEARPASFEVLAELCLGGVQDSSPRVSGAVVGVGRGRARVSSEVRAGEPARRVGAQEDGAHRGVDESTELRHDARARST